MDRMDMQAARLRRAGAALRLLNRVAVDDETGPGGAAFDQVANVLIELTIATPAADLEGFRTKAEAVAWCCGSRTDFGLGRTASERAIGSLLHDLLAA